MKPVETTQSECEAKIQGFQYGFTVKEFFSFLFGKKDCPKCGGKLTKNKRFVIVKGADLNGKSDPFFTSQINVKRYVYLYICQQCGSQYTLKDLTS